MTVLVVPCTTFSMDRYLARWDDEPIRVHN